MITKCSIRHAEGAKLLFLIAQGNKYRVTCHVTNIECVWCELLHNMFHPCVRVASPSLSATGAFAGLSPIIHWETTRKDEEVPANWLPYSVTRERPD